MTTQAAPVELAQDSWVLVSDVPCIVQIQRGFAWLRVASAPPSAAPVIINDKEHDGILIGAQGVPDNKVALNLAVSLYGRAKNADGAVLIVTET